MELKRYTERLGLDKPAYLVTSDQLKGIVQLAIEESCDAARWGESIDIGVLGLRINRLLGEEDG